MDAYFKTLAGRILNLIVVFTLTLMVVDNLIDGQWNLGLANGLLLITYSVLRYGVIVKDSSKPTV